MLIIRGEYLIILKCYDENEMSCEIDITKFVSDKIFYIPNATKYISDVQNFIDFDKKPIITINKDIELYRCISFVLNFDSRIIGGLYNDDSESYILYQNICNFSDTVLYYGGLGQSQFRSSLYYLHKNATSDIDFLKLFLSFSGCSEHYRILKMSELKEINIIKTPLNGKVSPLNFYTFEDIIGEMPVRKLTVPTGKVKLKRYIV